MLIATLLLSIHCAPHSDSGIDRIKFSTDYKWRAIKERQQQGCGEFVRKYWQQNCPKFRGFQPTLLMNIALSANTRCFWNLSNIMSLCSCRIVSLEFTIWNVMTTQPLNGQVYHAATTILLLKVDSTSLHCRFIFCSTFSLQNLIRSNKLLSLSDFFPSNVK